MGLPPCTAGEDDRMKVQCPKCSTSYRLPKGKAPSGGFKVRCKNCGHVIDVAAGEGTEPAADDEVRWYLASGTEKQGPFGLDELERRLDAGEATPDTLVWRKGFKTWTRIADVEEFQERFAPAAGLEEDATQLMPLGGGPTEDPASAAAPGEGDDRGADAEADGGTVEPMVWQRRETSVLFSLDDYKVRKRTQQTPAIKQADLVVPAAVAASSPEGAKAASKVGVISLDESEIRQVAESLARRRKQRRAVVIAIGGVALIAVVAVAAFLLVKEEPKPAPEIAVPVAVAPVQPSVPAPAPAPAPEVPRPAVAEGAPAAPEAQGSAEVGEAGPEETQEAVASDEEAPAAEPGKKTAARTVATRKPRPAAAPATEPRPAPASAPKPEPKKGDSNVVDANTLLAQYKGGKGSDGAKGDGGGEAAPSADSNLPAQLSMAQVASVLRKKQGAVESCVKTNGMPLPFRVSSRVVIDGSGKVVSASAAGAGAAQSCIEGALRSARFPRFKGDDMTVPFPFTVR